MLNKFSMRTWLKSNCMRLGSSIGSLGRLRLGVSVAVALSLLPVLLEGLIAARLAVQGRINSK